MAVYKQVSCLRATVFVCYSSSSSSFYLVIYQNVSCMCCSDTAVSWFGEYRFAQVSLQSLFSFV